MRGIYFFIISCLLAAVRLCATGSAPAMRQFTVADGLPSLEVHCIFQDSGGKMWFGTDVGASCYDGVTFVNYTRRDNLPDHTIFRISEDHLGRIWFRSYNGLLSWFDGQKIIQPAVNTLLLQRLKGRVIMSEDLDDHDTLWIGLKNEPGWIKIPPGYTYIIEDHSTPYTLIKEIRKGHLVGTAPVADPVFFFQPYGGATKIIKEFKGNNWPYSGARLADGRYVVNMCYTRYIISSNQIISLTDSCSASFINPEKDGSYWLCGMRPGGARLMSPGKDGEELLHHYLGEYDVTGCLRDHEGGLWFSTLENGVFYMPFPEIQDVYELPLSTGDHVTCITSWPAGGVLMGTLRGKFILANAGSCAEWQAEGLTQNRSVTCMSTIGNSILLGSAYSRSIFDYSKQQMVYIENLTYEYGSMTLKCAMAYDDQRWCAASINSLMWINRHTGKVEILLKQLPERITSIARTRGDTLWLGGFTRLWMFVPGQEPVDMSSHFPLLAQQADELIGDTISGKLWILSRSSGVFQLTSNGVLEIHEQQPNLPLICRKMLLLNQSLWVGTNAGVWELKMREGEKTTLWNFNVSNGLPSNDIIHLCVSGNRVWSSGNNMLFSFQPGKYPQNKIAPQVCFREIFCNDHLIPVIKNDAAEFHFTENTFRFQLAGQTYKSGGHPKFLVRLIGADEWHVVEESNITYYNLPPGDYKFLAYTLNNSGVRSCLPVNYAFSILPPFWKTDWFIGIMTAVILFVIYLLARNYVERFKREETTRRTMAELEITAIRAQMNPHFIFNAINSIYNFVLTGDRKASASYVSRFARLIRNVLEFASLKKITLEQEIDTLRLYMDIEQLRFREPFDYEIKIDPGVVPSSLQVVPMIIQPYVENAIWHGLSPKDGKGNLIISIEKNADHLICKIDDNGIGRVRAALTEQPGIAKQPLSGKLNQRRLALLQDLYGIGFNVQYIDKYLPGGTASGTTVILNIPAT